MNDLPSGFPRLEALRRFLSALRDNHVRSLSFYFSPEFAGFYHKHEKDKPRMSKSSTATCVLSLVRAGIWKGGPWEQTTQQTVRTLLTDEWKSAGLEKDNPFTVSFILEAVTSLDRDLASFGPEPELRERLAFAEGILAEALRKGPISLAGYPPSAYLTQLASRVLKQRGKLPKEVSSTLSLWAQTEIDHQLSLLLAKSKTADVFQLAYSVMLVADLSEPGESTPDQGLLLRVALDEFFTRQLDDGTWPRSRPLFHYPGVGSAYCFEYEMLVQLLQTAPLHVRLLRYIQNFSRAAFALEDTSFELENGGRGWTSGHHPQLRGPESWSTASVYHFAYALDRILAEAIRRAIFEELDIPYLSPIQPRKGIEHFAPDLLDCPIKLNEATASLKATLFKYFAEPIAKEAPRVEDGRSMTSTTPMSAIFFWATGNVKN